MGRLLRFLRLPPTEKRILVKVFILLWGVRLGLWLLPFQTLRRLLKHFASPVSVADNAQLDDQGLIIGAINKAGRYLPGNNTCLTQAFVGQLMLNRRGIPAALCIGVKKGAADELQAHAWVESNGIVLIGGLEAGFEDYAALPDLDSVRS